METFNSWNGRLVKGRDLKSLGLTWVKVTNEKMNHYDYQYRIGENEDMYELTINDCSRGGLYFCPFNNI
jgi:catechol-2,3-dioxygenase